MTKHETRYRKKLDQLCAEHAKPKHCLRSIAHLLADALAAVTTEIELRKHKRP